VATKFTSDLMKQFKRSETDVTPEQLALWQRHADAAHGVQSAIAFEIVEEIDPNVIGGPMLRYLKHLRVGIDINIVDISSITTLLVTKGLLSWDEVHEALAIGMEREKKRREAGLTEKFKTPVSLG
jgi:hypothetical protein